MLTKNLQLLINQYNEDGITIIIKHCLYFFNGKELEFIANLPFHIINNALYYNHCFYIHSHIDGLKKLINNKFIKIKFPFNKEHPLNLLHSPQNTFYHPYFDGLYWRSSKATNSKCSLKKLATINYCFCNAIVFNGFVYIFGQEQNYKFNILTYEWIDINSSTKIASNSNSYIFQEKIYLFQGKIYIIYDITENLFLHLDVGKKFTITNKSIQ